MPKDHLINLTKDRFWSTVSLMTTRIAIRFFEEWVHRGATAQDLVSGPDDDINGEFEWDDDEQVYVYVGDDQRQPPLQRFLAHETLVSWALMEYHDDTHVKSGELPPCGHVCREYCVVVRDAARKELKQNLVWWFSINPHISFRQMLEWEAEFFAEYDRWYMDDGTEYIKPCDITEVCKIFSTKTADLPLGFRVQILLWQLLGRWKIDEDWIAEFSQVFPDQVVYQAEKCVTIGAYLAATRDWKTVCNYLCMAGYRPLADAIEDSLDAESYQFISGHGVLSYHAP
jgi:hypothetical protein